MQAVFIPSSPTPPGGASAAPANPPPQSAGRDGAGFGQVLRELSDQPPGQLPEVVLPEDMLTETAGPDASVVQAGADGNLLLLADMLPPVAANQAEQPEADLAPATDLLVLLVAGAAVAARLPPAAFTITQAAEGAMTLLASDGAGAGAALAGAEPGPTGILGPPLSPPDAADESRLPTPPQMPVPAGVDMRDPELPRLAVQTGPGPRPGAEAALTARITVSAPDLAAVSVPQQAGAVPAVFAFRSTELSEVTEHDGPGTDPVRPTAAPSPAAPGTAVPEPATAPGSAPLADLPDVLPPSVLQGDADIQFAAPPSVAQTASAPAPHGVGAAFVPAPLAATLSDLLLRQTGGPVELTLSPEELGRVRLSLSPDGDGLLVTVQVERGDTLDLLRRSSDLLLQEIRAQGFSGATFSFSGWDGDRPESPASSGTGTGSQTLPSDPAGPVPPLSPSSASGLDLRL